MSVLTFPEGDNSLKDLWSCHLRKILTYFLLDPLKIRCHTVKSYHNLQKYNTHMLTVFTIQITGICSTLYFLRVRIFVTLDFGSELRNSGYCYDHQTRIFEILNLYGV